MTQQDYERIAQAGVAALQRGDARAARQAFEEVVEAGRASHQLWLLLAQSCEMLEDGEGMKLALAPVLEAEPRNIYALLMRGELDARNGDERGATSWFSMAVNAAAGQSGLPTDLDARLDKARAAMADASGRFSEHLHRSLRDAGVSAQDHPRFAEAIDILEGKAQPQFQQPTSFFYPRLPQIPFYPREAFDWIPGLEAAARAMRDEAQAVLARGEGLAPYVEAEPTRPNKGHALLGKEEWSAFYLWRDGAPVAENAAHCPVTAAAIAELPMPRIAGRSPMAIFSVLKPKTHIPPHWGMLNTRLICHIPLIVPYNCRLRVGNETRPVEFGKAMIFDDSIEHEAWNDSDETRVVLLLEVWRPELNQDERHALTTMFEAIGRY